MTQMRTRWPVLRPWVVAAVGILCFFIVEAGYGQNLTGTINGVVEDSSGAVVPNATVTIANAETAVVERVLKTDTGGRYEAPALLSGTYKITVRANGFETAVVAAVPLNVDQSIPINVKLKVGSVTSQVSVSTVVTGPDVEDSAQSTLIERKEVTELPLNQRNFLQFLSLQPGVNGGTGTITRGPLGVAGGNNDISFSVNGQPHTSNGYYLDGADFLSHDEDSMLGMYPSVDALQETNLLRDNYGAQYGGQGAAIVNLVTKAGTDQFHGDAYFFFRNQLLNANGYFNDLGGLARIPFRYNDFGYTIGGPLYLPKFIESAKKNTFFFLSNEFLRSAQAASSSAADDPTQLQRQGVFSTPVCVAYNAKGTCTSTSTTVTNIDPTAQAFLSDVIDKTPVPNDPSSAQELLSSFDGIMNESQILARVDHSFSDKLKVFARFMNDPYNSVAPEGIGGNTNPIPGLATTAAQSGAQNILGHLTYIPTATWVIEAGISHMRAYENTQVIGLLSPANAPNFNPAMPYPNLTGKLPTVTIDATKYNSAGPIQRINPIMQEFVNVTHIMGRHTILFGINAERMTSAYVNLNDGNNGGFTFKAPSSVGNAQAVWNQSFADFLIGYVTSFSQQNTIVPERFSASVFEAYLQDNVIVNRHLIVNAGVRYSYYRDPTEWLLAASNNFDPATFSAATAATISSTGYICLAASCPGGGVSPNPNYNPLDGIITPSVSSPFGRKMVTQPNLDFAPRFGFAYSPFSDGKTAIRGGVGIYYMEPNIWTDTPTGNPPAAISASGTDVSFDNPSGSIGAQTTPPALGALGINNKVAYIENYNFDVQRELPTKILLDVAYTGNVVRHLPESVDTNQPLPGAYVTGGIAAADGITSSNTPELNRIRPYLGYGDISAVMPIFSSNYNALQVQVRQHIGNTLELGGAYTWSRALGVYSAQNYYDIAADYGPSSDQRNHIFAAQFVYNLPFYRNQEGIVGHALGGYEISGIVNRLSGGVATPSDSNDDPAGIGLLASGNPNPDRPNRVGDPNNGPHTIQEWFNTSAFAIDNSGVAPGDAGVGSIYNPSTTLFTLSLMRNVRLKEGTSLQLRAEAYNVFNHTNWNGANTSINSTSFGIISGNGDPRNMQLAAKFTF